MNHKGKIGRGSLRARLLEKKNKGKAAQGKPDPCEKKKKNERHWAEPNDHHCTNHTNPDFSGGSAKKSKEKMEKKSKRGRHLSNPH